MPVLQRLLVCLVAVWAAGLSVPAFAANEVYTVRNISVDATAEGAVAAKEIAIAQGQRAAFNKLMRRLTRQQDWTYLPNPSAEALTSLVLGVEVSEERSSSTRYVGRVTYSFRPTPVKTLLTGAGLPFSETRAKPALLLAVLQTADGAVLFGDPNPWRAEWAERDLSDELVPLLIPLNDLEDSRFINAEQALTAKWDGVRPIAEKYGLERVVIAVASSRGALGQGQLDVEIRQLSASQETRTSFNFAPGADTALMLERAVDSALQRLYEEWKAATIVTYGQESVLVASAWLGSLQDWLTMRRRLDEAPSVSGTEILGLSPKGAELRIKYSGTPGQLKISLEQVSLILSDAAGYWEIALAERGLHTSLAPSTAPLTSPSGDYAAPGAPIAPTDLPHNTN